MSGVCGEAQSQSQAAPSMLQLLERDCLGCVVALKQNGECWDLFPRSLFKD